MIPQSLRDIGERNVIEEMIKIIGSRIESGEILTYPDDAKDVLPRGPRIIVSIDGYGIFKLRLPWRDLRDVGWCAITGSVSDVIVKGAFPEFVLLALGLPPDLSTSELRELSEGIKDGLEHYGVRLIGGDTNVSDDPWIAVATIGFTPAKKPPSRNGLRNGDVLIVTGFYGAMGLVAEKGLEESKKREWVVKVTRRPTASKSLAAVVSSNYRWITASMDVSDGLGYTLLSLAKASGVKIALNSLPLYYPQLRDECGMDEDCILKLVMTGGEEYGAVLGVKPEGLYHVEKDLKYYQIPYRIVGRVESGDPIVLFKDKPVSFMEWDQFQGWRSTA